MTKKALREQERAEALDRLRNWLPPGSKVYCVIRNVSRSGMSRGIDFYTAGGADMLWCSGLIAKALDMHLTDGKGIRVQGCGMDMGFHVVSNLGYALYPDGFECIGQERRCPASDHSNGDRDYSPHHHNSGGYALVHSWL